VRWGILTNLAVILTVSGILLFLVFCSSLERSAIDLKVQQATMVADLLENRIMAVNPKERLWPAVRELCRSTQGFRFLLYDADGGFMGGCGVRREFEKPFPASAGRRVKITGAEWPASFFYGMVVLVDVTAKFPHGIRTVRGVIEIPPSVFAPAWKFFGIYLILTQGALFFLGYYLFHRTVIGPVSEVSRLAGKAVGIADFSESSKPKPWRGDIQTISSSLRAMVVKIIEDRGKMEEMVEQLRALNSELESAQQGLIRSEKMAGVGRLAAGLAHEIGNPLQIVMGYVELLKRGPDTRSSEDVLARMDQELKRIHQILYELLEFARPMKKNTVYYDVNALVKDCESLVKGRKGFRKVEFEYLPEPEIPLVKTDPEKIRQILVNLIFNAADALPEARGKITLATRMSPDTLEIEVRDNGTGIARENLDKIFDPFFTTKEAGKGTGLGLAVCMGLAESLGGTITIESEIDKGTAVFLRLPIEDSEGRMTSPNL